MVHEKEDRDRCIFGYSAPLGQIVWSTSGLHYCLRLLCSLKKIRAPSLGGDPSVRMICHRSLCPQYQRLDLFQFFHDPSHIYKEVEPYSASLINTDIPPQDLSTRNTQDTIAKMKVSLFGSIALIAALSHVGLATPIAIDKRADGTIEYYRADNGAHEVLYSPPNDVCNPIPGGAKELSNYSDATAFLYATADCRGGYDIVGVAGTWFQQGVYANGFRLGSAP